MVVGTNVVNFVNAVSVEFKDSLNVELVTWVAVFDKSIAVELLGVVELEVMFVDSLSFGEIVVSGDISSFGEIVVSGDIVVVFSTVSMSTGFDEVEFVVT